MLILLDIDGVMVPAKSWSAPPIMEDGFYMFNSNSVAALNEIISKSGASVLLTTSHKNSFTLETWRTLFKNRGVNLNSLGRLSKNLDHLDRLQEITNWFTTNENIQDFVILDDDKTLNGLSAILKERLVQTKSLVGLTSSHVDEALKILKTPLELV